MTDPNMKTKKITEDEKLLLDISESIKSEEKTARAAHKKAVIAEKMDSTDSPADTKKLLIGIIIVFAVFTLFFIISRLTGTPEPMTVDEMHTANLAGDLPPEQGYMYNGYSFINLGGVWYSQVAKGDTLYDISFNNDPKSVENISVEGQLSSNFVNGDTIYITFDPDVIGTKFITVANAGLSIGLTTGFGYNLIAGCTDNESSICTSTNVITCEDDNRAVVYFKEASETKLVLEDNCVTVQGIGPEIIRAKDRLLMRWYGIMDN